MWVSGRMEMGQSGKGGVRGWSHVSKIYIELRVSVRTREHAQMLKKIIK